MRHFSVTVAMSVYLSATMAIAQSALPDCSPFNAQDFLDEGWSLADVRTFCDSRNDIVIIRPGRYDCWGGVELSRLSTSHLKGSYDDAYGDGSGTIEVFIEGAEWLGEWTDPGAKFRGGTLWNFERYERFGFQADWNTTTVGSFNGSTLSADKGKMYCDYLGP
ncbi:MAG: hypothetical protein ACE368_03385 [Paracoccaceae bacterium]